MEMRGPHAPTALPPAKSPQYPKDRRLVDPRAGVHAVEELAYI
jgi:hypothetical protein